MAALSAAGCRVCDHRRMIARHRALIVGSLIVGALVLTGCGSGTSLVTGSGRTRTAARRTGPAADPSAVKVIKGWSEALIRGDVRGAARYFHIPSVFIDGPGAALRIRSLAQAESANEALPCGARFVSAQRQGRLHQRSVQTDRPSRAGRRTGRLRVGHRTDRAHRLPDPQRPDRRLGARAPTNPATTARRHRPAPRRGRPRSCEQATTTDAPHSRPIRDARRPALGLGARDPGCLPAPRAAPPPRPQQRLGPVGPALRGGPGGVRGGGSDARALGSEPAAGGGEARWPPQPSDDHAEPSGAGPTPSGNRPTPPGDSRFDARLAEMEARAVSRARRPGEGRARRPGEGRARRPGEGRARGASSCGPGRWQLGRGIARAAQTGIARRMRSSATSPPTTASPRSSTTSRRRFRRGCPRPVTRRPPTGWPT